MEDGAKSNLVITGDMLFHRRIDHFIRSAFESDIAGNQDRYVTIVQNLACEILPRLNKNVSENLQKRLNIALDIYQRAGISGSKVAQYKLNDKAKAFFIIKKIYSQIISEAHAQGIFLRESKEKVKAKTIEEYFNNAKI